MAAPELILRERLAPPAVVAAVSASVAELPRRYLPHRAPGDPRRYRLHVTGCPPFTIMVDRRACRVRRGEFGAVDAELRTDPASWLDLASGDRAGLDLFFHGCLEVVGDLNEALRLETLFAPPAGSPVALGHAQMIRYAVHAPAGRAFRGHVEVETFQAGDPTAPPVLFLHGLGASKVSLLPAIAGLVDRHRVIAIDLPGFGKSSAPLAAPYHAPWLAEVTQRVLDAAGVDRVAVVGNSMGGRIAVELALRAPDRVRALGLLCPAVAFDEYRLVRPLLSALRVDIALGSPWWPVARVPRRFLDAGLRSLFADPGRVPVANLAAAREDFLRSLQDRRRRLAFLACTRRLGLDQPRRFWRELAALDVPSLWVFGDRDPLVCPAYAGVVRATLPAAAVEVWPSCGHVPQFEHPVATVERLQRFFEATPE